MSARHFRIAFVARDREPVLGTAILALGAVALAIALLHLADARTQAQAFEGRIRAAMPAATSPKTRLTRDELRGLNDQVHAVNAVVENLNLAWDEVFRAVRVPEGLDVVLTGLDTAGRGGLIRVHGETRQFEAMTDYVDLLAQKPAFAGAQLVKHEVPQDNPRAPYRFTVEAAWKR